MLYCGYLRADLFMKSKAYVILLQPFCLLILLQLCEDQIRPDRYDVCRMFSDQCFIGLKCL